MDTAWPYHFVSLSEDEKIHRRELLDIRGAYAQWSILIAISTVRLYQGWHVAVSRSNGSQSRRVPVSWWDRPLVAGWIETRRQYLVCGLWLGWLLTLSVWRSGDDYLHLTKALGHVALSQVPFQVLMSPAAYISTSKPAASSVFAFLTSVSQTTVTPYHRVFGRLVISPLLFGHVALYLLFFFQSSHPEFGLLIYKRVRDLDVQCGLLAISVAVLLLLFVRPRGVTQKGAPRTQLTGTRLQARRRSFYIGHVCLVAVLCSAAYYHVAQAQKYMLQTLGAFVLNGACSLVMVRWGGKS